MASVKKPKALEPGAIDSRRLSRLARCLKTESRAASQIFRDWDTAVIPRDDSANSEGYFAANAASRARELISAFRDHETGAVISTRGGYGSTYLIDTLAKAKPPPHLQNLPRIQ